MKIKTNRSHNALCELRLKKHTHGVWVLDTRGPQDSDRQRTSKKKKQQYYIDPAVTRRIPNPLPPPVNAIRLIPYPTLTFRQALFVK